MEYLPGMIVLLRPCKSLSFVSLSEESDYSGKRPAAFSDISP
jgi:hypothetical protein